VLLLASLAPAGSPASEQDDLFAALGVRAGLRIADVGAGDGEWAEKLAREVGESGHVYATEVDAAGLEKIEKRVEGAGLGNVTAILGSQQDTGLPAECCDAILLRMVYHHFGDPARMRASLRRALRPEAPLVIVDTEPQKGWRQLDGVPDRGGHGIREKDLVREMTRDGFEVVARHASWNGDKDKYCIVFRRARAPVVRSRRHALPHGALPPPAERPDEKRAFGQGATDDGVPALARS
jgi:ubiquinone/menaquinone biosynthesis C-methylase UbiE